MRRSVTSVFVMMALLFLSVLAQDKQDKSKGEMAEPGMEEMESMAPPEPLNDPWTKWMTGEWEGESESNMGKTQDWLKIEKTLNNQFCVLHLKSKTISMNPEAMKMMNVTAEQAEAMKEMPYTGMGMFTFDPKTGKTIEYWFDSWRGAFKGVGTKEGNKITSHWEGPMGTSVRTIEKVNENEMVMTYKETMGEMVVEGKSVMKRKEMMTEK